MVRRVTAATLVRAVRRACKASVGRKARWVRPAVMAVTAISQVRKG